MTSKIYEKVEITDAGSEGKAIARIGNLVVFIPFVVPGDVADIQIIKKKKSYLEGRAIRFHTLFQPAGTNVNFVQVIGPQELQVRTYERGVEGETLACGTGSVAAALIACRVHALPSPIAVHPSSGETLTIYFDNQDGNFRSVFLEGEAVVVFQGDIWLDELS